MPMGNPFGPAPDPTVIFEIATGFWGSKTLMCAVELEIFTKLSGKSVTMDEIQKLLDLPSRHTESFVTALLSLGLLTWKKHKMGKPVTFMNSRLADTFLVRGNSLYVGDFVAMYDDRLYKKWDELVSALKSKDLAAGSISRNKRKSMGTLDELYNQALLRKKEGYLDEQGEMDKFVRAMYGEKLWDAIALCKVYDFSKHKKMIDLGGGPAVFSIQIVKHFSNISALVIDTEPVCRIANEYIQRFNIRDRITTQALDFTKSDLPKGFDIIFMSHIIVGMSKQKNISLLRKAYTSLPEGGTIMINEWLLNDDKTGPKLSALMGLNMILETSEGKSYSFVEIYEMLTEAGFVGIEKTPILSSPGHLILGYKRDK